MSDKPLNRKFMECSICSVSVGCPILCPSCQYNRDVINTQGQQIENLVSDRSETNAILRSVAAVAKSEIDKNENRTDFCGLLNRVKFVLGKQHETMHSKLPVVSENGDEYFAPSIYKVSLRDG